MAGSVNKAILIGNLGQDPEVRQLQNGEVMSLRVATSERWKDKNTGEMKEQTEWHTVEVWGRDTRLSQWLRKGMKVYVEGQIRTRKWQDQNGNDRWSTSIHVGGFGSRIDMLDKPPQGQGGYGSQGGQQGGQSGGGYGGGQNQQQGGQGSGYGGGGGNQGYGQGNQGGYGGGGYGNQNQQQGQSGGAYGGSQGHTGTPQGGFPDDEIPFAAEWR